MDTPADLTGRRLTRWRRRLGLRTFHLSSSSSLHSSFPPVHPPFISSPLPPLWSSLLLPSAALPVSGLIWWRVSDRVSDHHLWVEERDPRSKVNGNQKEALPITEEEEEGRRPSLRGSWRPGDSLPFPYLYSTTPLFYNTPSSSVSSTPYQLLSPMSHDETHTHYLQPYYSPGSSTDTGPSNNHKEDGPFDPGNTPPLIFAFIAVGFIIFGVIVAVIYKKCRPLPNSPDPHQRSSVPSRRSSIQKPRLWDVWIAPNQPASDEERTKLNDWHTFVVSRTFCPRRLSSIGWLISTPAASINIACIPLFSLSRCSYSPTIRSRPCYKTYSLGEPGAPVVLQTPSGGRNPPRRCHDLYAQITPTTRTHAKPAIHRVRIQCRRDGS